MLRERSWIVIALRGRLKRSLWNQASDHESNHGDVNQGFRCFRQALIVDLEPTMAPQPSERTFHNPAPRHHRESVPIFWLAHDLQSSLAPFSHSTSPRL